MNNLPVEIQYDPLFRDAISSGDKKKALEAIRDQLAWKLDTGVCSHCGGPKGETAGMASIARELRQVLNDIDSIPDAAEVTELDRIRAARDKRVAGADDLPVSGKSAPRQQGGRRPGAGRRAES